jgi:DNA polymerase-4
MTLCKIVHIDLDAFYCAVEELQDPSLKGKPFAVGGRADQRGVISSCSYAARQYGVRSAMPTARALKLCPDLITLRGNYRLYTKYSRQVMSLLKNYTHLIEQISIDEAFLDVTDIPDSRENIAYKIRNSVNKALNLPCSLGVSTNKLIAKIATDVGKASAQTPGSPNAIQIVPPGEEAAFIAPLPVEMLWGVGPKTAAQLANMQVYKIYELRGIPESVLVDHFGKFGHSLYRRSRGIDNREIVTSHISKSISNETTFSRDINDESKLIEHLERLSDRVSKRLQKQRLAGTTIKLKLRWSDFTTFTRQTTIEQPTNQSEEIFTQAKQLLLINWSPVKPVRLLGVGVSGLGPPIRQLSLWENDSVIYQLEKEKQLRQTLSYLRGKYGDRVIFWGTDQEE